MERPNIAREIHDAKLVSAIEKSFKDSNRTYGARRGQQQPDVQQTVSSSVALASERFCR